MSSLGWPLEYDRQSAELSQVMIQWKLIIIICSQSNNIVDTVSQRVINNSCFPSYYFLFRFTFFLLLFKITSNYHHIISCYLLVEVCRKYLAAQYSRGQFSHLAYNWEYKKRVQVSTERNHIMKGECKLIAQNSSDYLEMRGLWNIIFHMKIC